MLSKFKRNKHQQHLAQLPKISQSVDDEITLVAKQNITGKFGDLIADGDVSHRN